MEFRLFRQAEALCHTRIGIDEGKDYHDYDDNV